MKYSKIEELWLLYFNDSLFERGIITEIDRIDNDGDYCPENCRWITNAQNMDNTRRTRRYEYNGENLTLREWSNKTGLSRDLLSNRINGLGWSVEKAITTPVKEKYRHLVAKERKEKRNERNDLFCKKA